MLARAKMYHAANRERILTYQKELRKANPERVLAIRKAWGVANPGKAAAWAKTWREVNPEKAVASRWRYRLGPDASPELIEARALWSMVRREIRK